MFHFLFKYPYAMFEKGSFVLLSRWPLWLLAAGICLAAALFAFAIWRRQPRSSSWRGARSSVVWLLETALAALLLLLLWQPALSVATLLPRQNIVAVALDDSRSMNVADVGKPRIESALEILHNGLLKDLQSRFQLRLYRLGKGSARVDSFDGLRADSPATRIGDGLRRIAADSATLPVGAIVLLSDGADSTGGVDAESLAEIRRRHIPVHAIGFGRDNIARDVELDRVEAPSRTLAGARLQAFLSLRQAGFGGRRVTVAARENGRLAGHAEAVLDPSSREQIVPLLFDAGEAGVRNFEFSVSLLPGEENSANNTLSRTLYADGAPRRILYYEGEPRWEYKFLRRAVEDDKSLHVVSILRTTQNKIYRQGIASPSELEQGFPTRVADLFGFDAVILGSVEAAAFTASQTELLREFVDRRGGGLLFLGGRNALSAGGFDRDPFRELLPVVLPARKDTFRRDPATVSLTEAGRQSLIGRIEDDPEKNAARWKTLPALADFQDPGQPKPGALVLAEMSAAGAKMPLLATENFGRGRTAVFATGGSWHWQMLQPLADMSHEIFWRQLLRWLVAETPSRVVAALAASTPRDVVADDTRVPLRAEVRDENFLPAVGASVAARIIGPDGDVSTVALQPDPSRQGEYAAEWAAARPGAYIAEVVASRGAAELGRGIVTFRREDGLAENFHREQNRPLLERLASETGGRYWHPSQAARIPDEIALSDSGVAARQMHDLWDMPAVFFLALLLRSSEWLLRRKWGAV